MDFYMHYALQCMINTVVQCKITSVFINMYNTIKVQILITKTFFFKKTSCKICIYDLKTKNYA